MSMAGMTMSFRRWKLGLLVSLITGLAGGGVVAFVDPTIKWRAIVFILVYNICQNFLLFIKDHPIDNINFDTNPTTVITKGENENKS